MKILHIVREPDDPCPFEYALRQVSSGQNEVAVLLIHNGVYSKKELPDVKTIVLKDDMEARGIDTGHETTDYNRMIDLVFEYDRVITW